MPFKNKKIVESLNAALYPHKEGLKLARVTYYKKNNILDIEFLVSTQVTDFDEATENNNIRNFFENFFNFKMNYRFTFNRLKFSEASLLNEINIFFVEHSTLVKDKIDYNNINFSFNPYYVEIAVPVDSSVILYINQTDLKTNLENRLNMFSYEDIKVSFIEYQGIEESEELVINEAPNSLNFAPLQPIKITDITYINDEIYKAPYPIRDSLDLENPIVICGKVSNFQKLTSQKGKDYYKFNLSDTTGNIQCLLFFTKKIKDAISKINEETELLIEGETSIDKFSGNKVIFIRKVAFCKIDYDSIMPQVFIKDVPLKYYVLKPKLYEKPLDQLEFIDFKVKKNSLLKGEYVVLDVETTGLSISSDRIIEIAAVKLIDGEFHSYLETLVNPLVPIPQKVSEEVHHIYDDDVVGSPKLSEILSDFYKFMHTATLVAHNAPFDLGMLNNRAKEYMYNFNNNSICTLELAKQLIPGTKYNLINLAKKMGIEYNNAHRALNDAEATAKLLVKLMEIKESKDKKSGR